MNLSMLKSLQFLAYDKSLDNSQAMRDAWSRTMSEHGIKLPSWDVMSPIDRDESIFMALQLSGVDAVARKRIYPILDRRLWIPKEPLIGNKNNPTPVVEQERSLPIPTSGPVSPHYQAVSHPLKKKTLRLSDLKSFHLKISSDNSKREDKDISPVLIKKEPIIDVKKELPLMAAGQLIPDPISNKTKISTLQMPELESILKRTQTISSFFHSHNPQDSFGISFLQDKKTKAFYILLKRGSSTNLFECTRAKRFLGGVLSVQAIDDNGHPRDIGLGKVDGELFSFEIEDLNNKHLKFEFFLNTPAPYFKYLDPSAAVFNMTETESVELKKHPEAPTKLDYQPEANWDSDEELTEEDLMRLSGQLPMVAAPVQSLRAERPRRN